MISILLLAGTSLQAGGLLQEVMRHELPHRRTSRMFGAEATVLEDVDLDGVPDYAISAMEESYGGVHLSGAVRVYSGSDHTLRRILSNSAYQEYFGHQMCSAGDVDGDGRGDVAIACHASPGPGGTVQVFSPFSGALLWRTATPTIVALENGGDLNGDGWSEILVGGWNNVHGEVWLLSGRDGSVLGVKHALLNYSGFGSSLAQAGDLDGDGFPETVIGAPQSNPNTSLPDGSGIVYVFSFRRGILLHEFHGIGVQSALGWSVAGGRDVDGDGVPDVLAGARGNARHSRSHSGAVLFSGATGARIWEMHFGNANNAFGHAVELLDDADGDGRPDLLISAPYRALAGQRLVGGALLVSGKTLRVLATLTLPQTPLAHFGWSIEDLGDLDGDGASDFLAGAYDNFSAVYSFDPFLRLTQDRLSIAAGGRVLLRADFPAAAAGSPYRILASLGENDPGTRIGGWQVELNRDGLLGRCLRGNLPAFAAGWAGNLDAAGDATAAFAPGPGQLPSRLAGRTLSLVAIAGTGGQVLKASALRQIRLEP